METVIIGSVLSISALIILALFVWYAICDHVASTGTNYIFPRSCIRCNADLEDYSSRSSPFTISRQWYLNIEGLEVFPYAKRETEVPLCWKCFNKCKSNEDLANRISVIAATGVTLLFLSSLICGYVPRAGTPIWACIGIILLVFALTLLFADKVLHFLPPFAPPAYFTIIGKLRFRNKVYQEKFSLANPNPEVRLEHPPLPTSLFVGILLVLFASLLRDIFVNLDQSQTLGIQVVDIIIVLGKIASLFFVYRQKKIGPVLWFIILGVKIVTGFNPDWEEIVLGVVILPMFIYEWWQGQLT